MVKAHSSGRPATAVTALHALESRRGGQPVKEQQQIEIQMYLSKLKELVPHMPKNRKVSKLEVIQHVIDYICDLQTALEQNHPARRRRSVSSSSCSDSSPSPASNAAAAAAVLAVSSNRQPLGLLASIPNTMAESSTDKGSSSSGDVTIPGC